MKNQRCHLKLQNTNQRTSTNIWRQNTEKQIEPNNNTHGTVHIKLNKSKQYFYDLSAACVYLVRAPICHRICSSCFDYFIFSVIVLRCLEDGCVCFVVFQLLFSLFCLGAHLRDFVLALHLVRLVWLALWFRWSTRDHHLAVSFGTFLWHVCFLFRFLHRASGIARCAHLFSNKQIQYLCRVNSRLNIAHCPLPYVFRLVFMWWCNEVCAFSEE